MDAHAVIDQMSAAGLDLPPLPLDITGKVRRFGPKKAHWYRLRELRTDAGTWVVVGSFGNHKGQQRWRVDVDWRGIGEAERAALADRAREQAEAEAQRRAEASRRAAMTGGELWAVASRTGQSAYLQRKGVEAEACRYLPDGSIVVPLLRYDLPRDQALQGVQQIWADGTKRFTKGLAKIGTCVRLGHVVVGEPMLICEGYATGLTMRMAVDKRLPVFVALDAGNLQPVAEMVRALHPSGKILICADDDHRTPGNPGREKAHKTSRAVGGCQYVYPIFRPGHRGLKDTDFNDLHVREGLGIVRRQMRHVLPLLGSQVLSDDQPNAA